MNIGILALQGGYEAHARVLTKLNLGWFYVRSQPDLAQVDGLILPGGESTTLLNLLHENQLFSAVQELAYRGIPLFGTCAGAILLARNVISPTQLSLNLIDITIQRNAYGRQLSSKIVHGPSILKSDPMEMVFIRAPQIMEISSGVKIITMYEGAPVCVQQNKILAATFHPELTEDTTLHHYFVEQIIQNT